MLIDPRGFQVPFGLDALASQLHSFMERLKSHQQEDTERKERSLVEVVCIRAKLYYQEKPEIWAD